MSNRSVSENAPYPRFEFAIAKVRGWNRHPMPMQHHQRMNIISTNCTRKQKNLFLSIIVFYTLCYVHFVEWPKWSYEKEWARWEKRMQRSVANSVPPFPSDVPFNDYWKNSDYLEQFPNNEASELAVPIPNYELIGRIRGELAHNLREHAIRSCQGSKKNIPNTNEMHSLPVIGITVANDTPHNRYLRRLLYTVDLRIVGSIVVTWFDEQTELQMVSKDKTGLSHGVIGHALQEFIAQRDFAKIPWDEGFIDDDNGNQGGRIPGAQYAHSLLADAASLKLMSLTATSVEQFCIHDNRSTPRSSCRNELLILRFPTNMGCSAGVNNPLFTHPNAPHWLITNYDIAYPPGVLDAMGKELRKTKLRKPNLAVHTFGYLYGRGKLENPWSNFVMTSCAVANVGVWDENIFPAYYEDDDYRDRIRYVMGKWVDSVGEPENDAPQYLMNDKGVIHYQTDRHVSVAHGPLAASTYLSGTHEMMKKVQEEEEAEAAAEKNFLTSLQRWLVPHEKPRDPLQYESHRWDIVKEVSDSKSFFRCKHGALPDPGDDWKDSVRYFGWEERFLVPFVNRTRVSNWRGAWLQDTSSHSPWASWTFNATRRRCVHKAANVILQIPPLEKEKRAIAIMKYKTLCSVC